MFKAERSGACNNARCHPLRPSIEGSIPLYAWSGSPLHADSDKQCFSRKVFQLDEPALHSEQEQTRPRQAGSTHADLQGRAQSAFGRPEAKHPRKL